MRVSLHPFTLPLTAPLRLGREIYTNRSGVLLRVEREGVVGWGEALPLPGFSPETLGEARDALAWLCDDPGRLEHALEGVDEGFVDLIERALPPSARAAVEGALLTVVARQRHTTVARLLDAAASETITINGLLPAADANETTVAAARSMTEAGYRAVKLKVGRRAVADDAALVRRVAEAIGPDVALRLDANRAWPKDDALRFAEAISGVKVEYIEEPVADVAGLPEVAECLPVALDESLVGQAVDVLDRHLYARAVVLKPMLLGGIASAWRWAQAARRRGMVPVVSATFEAGVGMRLNAVLAAALGGDVPAGLDPYRWFAADVLPARLPLDGPVAWLADLEAVPDP